MPSATSTAPLAAIFGPLSSLEVDLLVVPWFEDEAPTAAVDVDGLDAATGGELGRAIARKEFQGKPFDMFVAPVVGAQWLPRRVALIGAGRRDGADADLARRLASAAGHDARKRRVARVAFALRGPRNTDAEILEMAQACAEGLTLAEFFGGSYKTTET